MQQTPVYWVKWLIKYLNGSYMLENAKILECGVFGHFESIAGSYDQIRASHNVSNFYRCNKHLYFGWGGGLLGVINTSNLHENEKKSWVYRVFGPIWVNCGVARSIPSIRPSLNLAVQCLNIGVRQIYLYTGIWPLVRTFFSLENAIFLGIWGIWAHLSQLRGS